ncbi:MAG: aminotransferase class V-fold PLP-dependent enzyme [Trueperaceae bacterium]|nr:aminotransferase class V-fold PLP-dependent enzyme [Trueperaceae bacterium]
MVEQAILLTDYEEAYRCFHEAHAEEQTFGALRDKEYARLDAGGHIYLDYTGGGLYAQTQLDEHFALLKNGVLGNPHSINPSSSEATRLVEQCRNDILSYFNTSSKDYVVIFTQNASGALKLVAESYPFCPEGRYLLSFDNHNSVLGIREYARTKGARLDYVPLDLPDLNLNEAELDRLLAQESRGGFKLFAYPAQSNFSGVKHSLDYIARAQAQGWDVFLDAAAFVPTNRLDLSKYQPDFVGVSFYKMFGYPTGIGCLLARRDSLKKLKRPWFAGGTITLASVMGQRHWLAEGSEGFEDGTVNYLMIPAVSIGLKHLQSIGIETISAHVGRLGAWLLGELESLKHSNGHPLIRLYGPADMAKRGATFAMNFYQADDTQIDHRVIELEASKLGISLRTGCFCNPGSGESAFGFDQVEIDTCFAQPKPRLTIEDLRVCIDGKSSGAVRVSLGIASHFKDVYAFAQFAKQFLS